MSPDLTFARTRPEMAGPMAFSGRKGGVSVGPFCEANVSASVGDDLACVLANRRMLMDRLGLSGRPLVSVRQAHGANVVRVTAGVLTPGPPEMRVLPVTADGMVARGEDVVLMVGVADCAPVLFADPDRAVIGALHVGWRGLLQGAVERMADALVDAGARLGSTAVGIGPTIGPCCLAVTEELRAAVAGRHRCAAATTRAGEPAIDLRSAVGDALRRAGLGDITTTGGCTSDGAEEYFSARREGRTGIQAGIVALRDMS